MSIIVNTWYTINRPLWIYLFVGLYVLFFQSSGFGCHWETGRRPSSQEPQKKSIVPLYLQYLSMSHCVNIQITPEKHYLDVADHIYKPGIYPPQNDLDHSKGAVSKLEWSYDGRPVQSILAPRRFLLFSIMGQCAAYTQRYAVTRSCDGHDVVTSFVLPYQGGGTD